ncbi:MAG: hypothetical protein RL701_7367 [Pseudomonadota bacterium]|jgi:hypothetical protein
MTIDLDVKALSVITAGLQALIDNWAVMKANSSDEDEISDLTNDMLFAQSLSSHLESKMLSK